MFESLAGWGLFLAEIAKMIGIKKLREHSDRYAQLEKELLEESQKDYTQRDDLRFVAICKEMAICRDAFLRDAQLGDK